MTDTALQQEALYFMRRLGEIRRVSGIPASIAFDLARSPLTDDELEGTAELFGQPKATGFGMSDMLNEILSKEPKSIPVNDLKSLQQNLIDQGYAPPGTEANGVWDPSTWYGPFRRADRDMQETLRSGHDWKSGTLEAGIRFITNTLPSRVWQGLVGTAKGLVLQAPETAGRVGALGGAAGGAAIGASLGTLGGPLAPLTVTAGAVGGAVVGGTIGFFADLFGEDEGEEDQGGFAKLIDALTPFEEYSADPRAFFEDLGWVGSAASIIGGVGLAAKGAATGMAAIRGAQMAPVLQSQALRSGAAMTSAPWELANVASAPIAQPLSFGAAALTKGAGQPGAFARLFAVATKPAAIPGTPGAVLDWVSRYGLSAQVSRPGIQLINKVYTGAAAAQLGSRFAAGFTGPRFDEFQGTTTIEKSIAETKPLSTGIEILGADIIDLPALLIWPERFFPFPKGSALKVAEKLMLGPLEGRRFQPYAHVLQAGDPALGYRAAYEQTMSRVTPLRDARYRATFGVHHEAHLRAASRAARLRPEMMADAVQAARFDIIREIRTAGARGDYGPLNRVGGYADRDPGAFEYWLRDLQGQGRGLDFLDTYDEVEGLALRVDDVLDKSNIVEIGDSVAPRSLFESERGLVPTAKSPYLGETSMRMAGVSKSIEEYLGQLTSLEKSYQTAIARTQTEAGRIRAVRKMLGEKRFSRVEAVLRDSVDDVDKFIEELVKANPEGGILKALLAKGRVSNRKGMAVSLAEEIRTAVGGEQNFALLLRGADTPGELLKRFKKLAAEASKAEPPIKVAEGRPMMPANQNVALNKKIAQGEYSNLINKAKELRASARRQRDPLATQQLLREAAIMESRAQLWKADFATGGLVPRGAENMRVVAERLATPTRGDYVNLSDDFLKLRQEVSSTFKANPEGLGYVEAQNRLNAFLQDLEGKGILPAELAQKAMKATPDKRVSEYLLRRADNAARDLLLDTQTMEQMRTLGYKPVLSGEDVLFTGDVSALAETLGGNFYSRRAALFETLGMSPKNRLHRSTYKYRVASEHAALQEVIDKHGLSLTKERMLNILHRAKEKKNHSGATFGPAVFPGKGQRPFIYKTDLRDLSLEDIMSIPEFAVDAQPDVLADDILRAVHRGAAFGGEASLQHMGDTLRLIGRELRVNGLPGFSDVIRTARVENPGKLVLAGAVAGAAEGAIVGLAEDKPIGEVVKQAVQGAAIGAGAGSALKFLAKRGHGYLPEVLIRANLALRFSLSMTFDAGRYMEQNTIAYTKYGLPFMFSPEKYIARAAREGRFTKSFTGLVDESRQWDDVVALWDHVNGTNFFQVLDSTDMRQYMRGVLNFSPRDWEAAQAYLLYQRGMPLSEIRDAVSHIGRYGPGQTAAERSANFIFFPFSFSKKLLSTLGDFMLQAPARNFLLSEGWRRYTESGFRDNVNKYLDEHFPIIEDIARINNLSFGLSPGRFFLEGLTDNRTKLGAVTQALASVFVPSGAATPLATLAGGLADLSVQAFSPVVVTGESINRMGGIEGTLDFFGRYVPFIRELNQYFIQGLPEQLKANYTWLGGEGLAPYSQLSDISDELRLHKSKLEPLALAMGYSSVDGLMNSEFGWPLKQKYERFRTELASKYPSGAQMLGEFENSALQEDVAILELSNKHNRSEGEEAIVRIAEEQWKWRMLKLVGGLPSDLVDMFSSRRIREFGLKYQNDRRFRELWEMLFERTYGPISMTSLAERTDEV